MGQGSGKKSQISYAKEPDVVVDVVTPLRDDASGYNITQVEPSPEKPFDASAEEAFARIEERQKDFPRDCRVTVDRKTRTVHVPFPDILVHATWQLLKGYKPERRDGAEIQG